MRSTVLVIALIATGFLLTGVASATPPNVCVENMSCGLPTPECLSDNSCFQCWTEQDDPTALHCSWQ